MVIKLPTKMFIYLITLYSLCWYTQADSDGKPICDQLKLRDEIFTKRKLNNVTLPVQSVNDTLDVTVFLLAFHVLGLDEQTETFSFDGWLMNAWQDLNLAWNTDDFKGCDYLTIVTQETWQPDIVHLNSAEPSEHVLKNLFQIVSSDGRVVLYEISNFRTICPLDLSNYPFDEHLCQLSFMSWSYTGNQLNLTLAHTEDDVLHLRALYDEHNEWEITNSFANISTWSHSDEVSYQSVDYFVRLKRRTLYYHFALLTPNAISILIMLLTFWLPHESNNKILVSGINLVVMTMLVIHCQWVVPRSGSNVPSIVIFYSVSTFLAAFCFLICVATTCIYNDQPSMFPPTWLKNLLNGWLGTAMCIDFHEMNSNSQKFGAEMSTNAVAWKLMAIAINRFCFVVFCFILTCLLVFVCA